MADDKAQKKVLDQKKAFAVYQQKCLTCHDSVADPEKEGRTRDDWHLVVNVMHGYGMDLTDAEPDKVQVAPDLITAHLTKEGASCNDEAF